MLETLANAKRVGRPSRQLEEPQRRREALSRPPAVIRQLQEPPRPAMALAALLVARVPQQAVPHPVLQRSTLTAVT